MRLYLVILVYLRAGPRGLYRYRGVLGYKILVGYVRGGRLLPVSSVLEYMSSLLDLPCIRHGLPELAQDENDKGSSTWPTRPGVDMVRGPLAGTPSLWLTR
jgi:hypothetical protein